MPSASASPAAGAPSAAPATFAAPAVAAASARWDVRALGAVGDGRTRDTAALARAVTACAAAGGGTVRVPAGRYLTGSIRLESRVTLWLDEGAELLYSGDPADSPLVASRWEGTRVHTHAPLIYAHGCEHVAIAGRGCLNGQGWNWWWRNGEHDPARAGEARAAREAWCALYARIEAGAEPGPGEFALAAGFLRPSLVQFLGCRDVAVEGVTLRESPMWMLHPIDCAHVAVRGVDFVSTGPNGDGVAVDSCTDVRIEHCRFTTGDDCIVLKSGRDADGRRWGRPTERVTIAHCAMERGHGAVVIGSETAGGVRDVVARHIVTRGTDRGIRVKSMRGRGGVVERLRFEHWSIADAPVAAIEVTAHYQARPAEPFSERTPVLRDFSFHHVAITNARQVAAIAGLAECPIAQLRFTDLTAAGALGFHCDEAVAVDLRRVRVQASAGPDYCFGRVAQVERDGAPWAPAAPTETAGSAAAAGPAAPAPIGA